MLICSIVWMECGYKICFVFLDYLLLKMDYKNLEKMLVSKWNDE